MDRVVKETNANDVEQLCRYVSTVSQSTMWSGSSAKVVLDKCMSGAECSPQSRRMAQWPTWCVFVSTLQFQQHSTTAYIFAHFSPQVALKFEHRSSKGCNYGPPYEWSVYK